MYNLFLYWFMYFSILFFLQVIFLSSDDSYSDDGVSTRTQYMTTAKNILIAGGDATERLMSSYKEVKQFLKYYNSY